MITDDILKALRLAVNKAGSQTELANQSKISQGRISNYLNGTCSVGNMTIDTLFAFFPEMEITFFAKESLPAEDHCLHEIINFAKGLTPEQRIKCLMLLSAHFPQKIIEETKHE